MDLGLAGKIALVTGASRGLGRAIAWALAREGVHVAVHYHRQADAAEKLAAEIRQQFNRKSIAIQADLACCDELTRAFQQAEAALGPFDLLVNNAGIWPTHFVRDMPHEAWEEVIAINLHGAFWLARLAINQWINRGQRGAIVNVVSQAAFRGATTGHAHYAAAKSGLVSFTVSLAREVAPWGVRVNAVAPGMMHTDMAQEALAQRLDEYLQRIPLRRIAQPEEIAEVVVFLLSERCGYVTGATWDVTGGMLMR